MSGFRVAMLVLYLHILIETEGEACPLPFFRFYVDGNSAHAERFIGGGQTEAQATGLIGKIGLEYMFQVFFADAAAIVFDP